MLSRLFRSRTPLSPDERQAIIDYYIRETELAAFQDREDEKHNRTLLQYGQNLQNPDSVSHLLEASNRLALNARQLTDRHANFGTVPDLAAPSYARWHVVYDRYQEWTEASYCAIEAISKGLQPNPQRVQQLLQIAETHRQSAQREDAKLLQSVRLTAHDLQRIYATGQSSPEQDDSTPPTAG